MTCKSVEEVKEYIVEAEGPDTDIIVFENPDYAEAFVGLSSDHRAVYDYEKMVMCLMKEDGMEEEEAREFIDYNTVGAWFGDKTPIILFPILE